MERRKLTSRKKVIAAAVAGLAVAGGGAGIAASQDDSAGSSFLDSVAKHLGISSQELEDAAEAAALDQVDEALDQGRITEEQAEELRSRIEAGEVPFFGPGFFGPGLGPRGEPGSPERHFFFGDKLPERHFFFGDELSSAADYLGLTEAELHEQLADGKSLADVAEAEGKTVDGLERAILDGARASLDEAVEAERLTREQADAVYERLQSSIDELVNGTFERRAPGFGPGFGPRFGGPPNDDGDTFPDTAA
jgi:hypothetical protein